MVFLEVDAGMFPGTKEHNFSSMAEMGGLGSEIAMEMIHFLQEGSWKELQENAPNTI